MDRAIEQTVRRRAGGLCEYCQLPADRSPLRFAIDHIVARQHRGLTTASNLALCCMGCNLHKGPNLTGLDPPGTGKVVRLFNPRIDDWSKHFRWNVGELVGLTPIGRVTIYVLDINNSLRIRLRRSLIAEGFFPREPNISIESPE